MNDIVVKSITPADITVLFSAMKRNAVLELRRVRAVLQAQVDSIPDSLEGAEEEKKKLGADIREFDAQILSAGGGQVIMDDPVPEYDAGFDYLSALCKDAGVPVELLEIAVEFPGGKILELPMDKLAVLVEEVKKRNADFLKIFSARRSGVAGVRKVKSNQA